MLISTGLQPYFKLANRCNQPTLNPKTRIMKLRDLSNKAGFTGLQKSLSTTVNRIDAACTVGELLTDNLKNLLTTV